MSDYKDVASKILEASKDEKKRSNMSYYLQVGSLTAGLNVIVTICTYGAFAALQVPIPLLSAAGIGIFLFTLGFNLYKTRLSIQNAEKLLSLAEALRQEPEDDDRFGVKFKRSDDSGPKIH